MADRRRIIAAFLGEAGWSGAACVPLAGDASARRYERLVRADGSAVLMDAPPGRGEDTTRFARMDRWLRDRGYSAPAILAEDHRHGLLLLEDLGDALVARLLSADPPLEAEIYAAATDFLADLHHHPPPGFVAALDGPALAGLTTLVSEWYVPAVGARATPASRALPGIVAALFAQLSDGHTTPSLRDFHAENLVWLPGRTGHARLGLLDFQDAVAAHPAYDLVSLLQDARRDVCPATEQAMITRYMATRRLDPEPFGAIYALLGAQRALRIVGVFARLALRDGKPQYLAYLPRVWAALARNLSHPALTELAHAVHAGLPEPSPARIDRITESSRCTPKP